MLHDFKTQIVEFETGDRKPLATINPNKYIQHNLRVADGLAGLLLPFVRSMERLD